MDQFKKYLQENRNELDSDTPRPMVWGRIEHELPAPVKSLSIMRVVAWSAAACVFVLVGVGVYSLLDRKPETVDLGAPLHADAKNKNQSLVDSQGALGEKVEGRTHEVEARRNEIKDATKQAVNLIVKAEKKNRLPERSEGPIRLSPVSYLEANFTQVINLQKARISTMPMYAESAAYFSDFKAQLKQMDKDEAQIKLDIARKGMNDEWLDQLINLYQQKLNILKQLQLEMNKTNNRYKQNRGAVDTVRTYFLSI
jgi:hypothetical protein